MRRKDWPRLLAALAVVFLSGRARADAPRTPAVDFNRDIRPMLSDNCFACHGPDAGQRKADLRLDNEADAFADRGETHVLVRGKPAESELFLRITGQGRGQMPPPKSGKRLTPHQVDLVRRWIEQGAKWQKHWSLLPPVRPEVPKAGPGPQPRNPIDAFLRVRLQREGLPPSPEADRRTLLRRLSFDLTGLPPTPAEVDAFLADRSDRAYEKAVDRLLSSRHYGERMALYWLDVVRFADTIGYHSDTHREISPYRDYVIDAFNNNKPFDRFVVEQLAGDLLPGATSEQKIASGFNRLLMTTEEGGGQPKEYLAKYASDRVRNTSSIFLGVTLGCCECHDHKFDPFTQKDFYRFAAYFADLQEVAVGQQPTTRLPTPAQAREIEKLDRELAALRAEVEKPRPELDSAQQAWEKAEGKKLSKGQLDWLTVKPAEAKSSGGATLAVQGDLSVLSTGKNPAKDVYTVRLPLEQANVTGLRLEALSHPSLAAGGLSRANGNFVLTGFEVSAVEKGGGPRPVKLASAAADFEQPGFPVAAALDSDRASGWAVSGHERKGDRLAVFTFEKPVSASALVVKLSHQSQFAQHNIGRFRLSLTTSARPSLDGKGGLPVEVAQALGTPAEKRTAKQKQDLARHFRAVAPQLQPQRDLLSTMQRRKDELMKTAPETLVSMSGQRRVVRVLPRGNWLDDSGEVVAPGVPASLGTIEAGEDRGTRRELARWMTAKDNPLLARVFVNRLWKLGFGQGLVKTLDDFGAQGTWPTHLELLDWLAVEFRDSGWDVKKLVKTIVTSDAYRQSSRVSDRHRQVDPYNLLLARQARYRLDAEMVRDNALAVSGLLVRKVGGKSVKPYQPPGYWAMLNFPKREWQNDQGDDLYRRGLYTYWCRTFPHPSLVAFDAPSREECVVERPRSNTPLQALVLLNDPIYVEAARTFAERIVREGGPGAARLNFAFREALGRPATDAELKLLEPLARKHLDHYRADRAAAQSLLTVGARPVPGDMDAAELAAWTSVARVLLNLHETITRD